MMAEDSDLLDNLRKVTQFMEEHNILKLKTGAFQIERGRAEDASDLVEKKEVDERMRAEMERIAAIRLNCPYPCPHWGQRKRDHSQESE
jgi:hypothetical protein